MKYHTLLFSKFGKMSQNLSSAAVVNVTLRVKILYLPAVDSLHKQVGPISGVMFC